MCVVYRTIKAGTSTCNKFAMIAPAMTIRWTGPSICITAALPFSRADEHVLFCKRTFAMSICYYKHVQTKMMSLRRDDIEHFILAIPSGTALDSKNLHPLTTIL